jgi:hypothetical protein
VEALEIILACSMVPILSQFDERQPELVLALLPSLVRTMLTAFVEVMAEQPVAFGPQGPPGNSATRLDPLLARD